MKKYLKLLILAIFASLSFAFVACGNDDEEDEPSGGNSSDNGFVGTWSMNMIGQSGEYKDNYIRFYDDSTFVLINADDDEVMVSYGTWSASGNTFTLDYAIAQNERPIIPYVITYNIKSQNSSKIEFYLGTLNFTFTKVSDSVMDKYQEEIDDVLGDDNGTSGDDNGTSGGDNGNSGGDNGNSGGNDDDEPNNGSGFDSGSISLTLDGNKYSFDSGVSDYDSRYLLIELINSKSGEWINFAFNEPDELSNGMVLTADMDFNGSFPVVLQVINYDGRSAGSYLLGSGSVKIKNINLNTKKFEVTFINAVFEEHLWDDPSIIVNGTFSVTLDVKWGSLFGK